MRRTGFTVALLALFSSDVFGANLSDFVGEWWGKGIFTRQTTIEREGRLTCRLKIVPEGSTVIVVNGRCAAPEGSRGFKTQITDGNRGVISGIELFRIGARKSRLSTGTLDNSGISLAGEDAEGSFEFRLSVPQSGQMEMRTAASENGKRETARVLLRKVD